MNKKTIIISNRQWFKNYLGIRRLIWSLALLYILFLLLKNETWSETVMGWTSLLFLPLFITLFLFEYYQKPAFFEVSQEANRMTFHLFIPNTKFFIRFKESYIKSLSAEVQDRILLERKKGWINILDQLQIYIQKPNAAVFKLASINLIWANRAQLKALEVACEQFNQQKIQQ
ncbi:MAG: hypothetical protein AAF849_22560 [Bacteroidota bacterium]